ncbi:MAG: NAD-binding protein [Chloroflexota bacterium]
MFVNFLIITQKFFKRFIRSQFGLILIPIVVLITIGTLGYSFLEGWTLLESLYVTIITITTIGYGDLSPTSSAGRIFAMLFAISAIGMASYAITTVATWIIEWEEERVEKQKQEKRMQAIESLENHVIICGASNIGRIAGFYFTRAYQAFIIIEADEDKLRRALLYLDAEYLSKKFGSYHDIANAVDVTEDEQLSLEKLAEKVAIPYLHAEPTDDSSLIAAGIGRARGVVASLDSDERNLFTVVSARALSQRLDNIKLRIIALVHDDKNGTKLQVAGADQLVMPEKGSGRLIQSSMMNPLLSVFNSRTMMGIAGYTLQQRKNDPVKSWAGETVAEVAERQNLTILAVWRDGEFVYSPAASVQLKGEDELIVFAVSNEADLFEKIKVSK